MKSMANKFYASTGIMVALFLIGLVLARPAKLRAQAQEVGGASIETATLVGEGEHNLGTLTKDWKYVKVNVSAGKLLEATFYGPSGVVDFQLLAPVSKETVEGLGVDPFPQTLQFAPGNIETSAGGEVYLRVKVGLDSPIAGVSVKIKLEDVGDAGKGVDAGDTFTRALAVGSGNYKGFLAPNDKSYHGSKGIRRGTDKADLYLIQLKKGDKLQVSAAPHETVRLDLRVYDSSRKIVAQQTSDNKGAIVTGRYVASKDQNAYFSVRTDEIENFPGHFYDLTVNVETPEGAPREAVPEPGSAPEPAGPIVIFDPMDRERLLAEMGLSRNEAEEETHRNRVRSDAGAFKVTLDDTQEQAVTNFVTYGISTATKKLGAGERRAVMRDYMETVGKSDVNYEDVERLSRGEKPVGRNLAKEQGQAKVALGIFKKMVGHAPNFQDSQEDLAWNTMMYRIRFSRDLEKEKAGILKFKKTFKKAPKTPMEWSAVRALGYVLE